MKYFMVIERFRPGCKEQIYKRFHKRGRMLPTGLFYLDSWLDKDGNRCFQLMKAESSDIFEQWTSKWEDLTKFEIIELGNKPEGG